jgi:hypothetical protein
MLIKLRLCDKAKSEINFTNDANQIYNYSDHQVSFCTTVGERWDGVVLLKDKHCSAVLHLYSANSHKKGQSDLNLQSVALKMCN